MYSYCTGVHFRLTVLSEAKRLHCGGNNFVCLLLNVDMESKYEVGCRDQ